MFHINAQYIIDDVYVSYSMKAESVLSKYSLDISQRYHAACLITALKW